MKTKGGKKSEVAKKPKKAMKNASGLKGYLEGNTLYVSIPHKTIDSSNITKFDKQLEDIIKHKQKWDIVFDMEKVEACSSSVLRRMVMLKNAGYNIKIINAGRKLYDIFAVVGFDKIVHIGTKKLNINTKNMKQFAEGGNGKIYEFTRDEILKIYYDFQSEEKIERGMHNAKLAFTKGLPVAIPYASVKTDQGIGIIYEKVTGKSLAATMHNNKKYFDTGAREMTKLCLQLATTHFGDEELTNVKLGFVNGLDPIAKFLPPHYVDAYNIAIEMLPETDTAVHGDFHAKNIMLEGNELLLIDVDDFGSGHPIWDVGSMYTAYKFLSDKGDEDETFAMVGMNVGEAARVWDIFCEEYFKGVGKRETQRRINAASWYGAIRTAKLYANRFELTTMKDPTTKFVVEMVKQLLDFSVMEHLWEMVEIFKTWKD